MATEQPWSGYASQGFFALADTVLVGISGDTAGARVSGAQFFAQRSGVTGEYLAIHAGDVGARVQTSGTTQSAYYGFIAQQAGVNDQWNIVAAGSGLGASSLRFVKGTWTNSPFGMFDGSGNFLVGITSNAAITTSGVRLGAAGNTVLSSATDGILALGYNGAAATATVAAFYRGAALGGSITTNGTSTAYNTSSDYRLKTNLRALTGALDRVRQLPVYLFDWIDGPKDARGFLAHEYGEAVPGGAAGEKDALREEDYEIEPPRETAVLGPDGAPIIIPAVMGKRMVPAYQGIDQSKIVPDLVGAVQELTAMVETLQARIAELETVR